MFRDLLPLFVLPALVFVIALVSAFLKSRNTTLLYSKKESLLSDAEKKFFLVLSELVKREYLLFSKVRIFDILSLPKGLDNSQYYRHKNKIQSKHVDFLLCDKESVEPILVIELDDSSHLRPDRISRDTFVDSIFEKAKLPILHIRASSSYNEVDLLNQIQSLLKNNYREQNLSLMK